MRSTFNILFYVNKSKEKNGVVPVMGRVTINGTQSQFSCKKSIPLDMWDVKVLTTDNIVDINGNKWIIGHRHKTGIPFQVKLMDVPLQIIDRYKHLQEDKLVFGKMNYWSMCKKLKTVMDACGIEKQISFHCGRHSFATLALSKGMPIESVSRVLGHTNIVTTQIYAKITSQKLNNDLTMLGDKLNASFKDIKAV